MTTNSTEVTVTLTFKLEDVGQCFSFRGYDDRTYTASSATVAMYKIGPESMPFIEYDEDCDEDTPSGITADDFVPYGYQVKPIWQKEFKYLPYGPQWLSSWWERSEGTRMREDGCILVEDAETYEEACALVKAEIIKTVSM